MSTNFGLVFGNTLQTGLHPTFSLFEVIPTGGTPTGASAPPGITELPTNSGYYYFAYNLGNNSIAFMVDGATSLLAGQARYIPGILDPIQNIDGILGSTFYPMGVTITAIGTTNGALGTTCVALGTTGVAIGTSGLAAIIGVGVTSQAIGASLIAQGVTLTYLVDGASGGMIEVLNRIGTTASSYGDTAVNPGTLYGFLKRLQEWNEGNSNFDKSTSLWDVYSRGSSTLLAEKTLNDSSGNVTKT